MDKIPDEVFAILTAKQKEVYLLRMEGMTGIPVKVAGLEEATCSAWRE